MKQLRDALAKAQGRKLRFKASKKRGGNADPLALLDAIIDSAEGVTADSVVDAASKLNNALADVDLSSLEGSVDPDTKKKTRRVRKKARKLARKTADTKSRRGDSKTTAADRFFINRDSRLEARKRKDTKKTDDAVLTPKERYYRLEKQFLEGNITANGLFAALEETDETKEMFASGKFDRAFATDFLEKLKEEYDARKATRDRNRESRAADAEVRRNMRDEARAQQQAESTRLAPRSVGEAVADKVGFESDYKELSKADRNSRVRDALPSYAKKENAAIAAILDDATDYDDAVERANNALREIRKTAKRKPSLNKFISDYVLRSPSFAVADTERKIELIQEFLLTRENRHTDRITQILEDYHSGGRHDGKSPSSR